ncbi:hypothetical protein [Streptomyces sp. NPDC048142]|uniref:hypothetical protein n=1 Tax=Streptomyces sp. NPDC048142 TaxID=3365501 RepID=UPI003717AE88
MQKSPLPRRGLLAATLGVALFGASACGGSTGASTSSSPTAGSPTATATSRDQRVPSLENLTTEVKDKFKQYT